MLIIKALSLAYHYLPFDQSRFEKIKCLHKNHIQKKKQSYHFPNKSTNKIEIYLHYLSNTNNKQKITNKK